MMHIAIAVTRYGFTPGCCSSRFSLHPEQYRIYLAREDHPPATSEASAPVQCLTDGDNRRAYEMGIGIDAFAGRTRSAPDVASGTRSRARQHLLGHDRHRSNLRRLRRYL